MRDINKGRLHYVGRRSTTNTCTGFKLKNAPVDPVRCYNWRDVLLFSVGWWYFARRYVSAILQLSLRVNIYNRLKLKK